MEPLYERTDFLERLCREYLNTFNMIRRLTKDLANAIRGAMVSKKVGKYTYFDHQIGRTASVPALMSRRRTRSLFGRRLNCANFRSGSSRR